jgi:hypothetical protein
MTTDNDSWIIEAGDAIIQRRGAAGLTPLERLIYCVWVADYGMRNAGDLTTARDLYEPFHEEALQLSQALGLKVTHSAFALAPAELERQYFERFDAICDELRDACG